MAAASAASEINQVAKAIDRVEPGRWNISLGDDAVLGRGAYGVVVRAHDSRVNADVAIKRVDAGRHTQRLLREVVLMRHLQHPNILQLHHMALGGIEEGHPIAYMVSELMQTDLFWVIFHSDQVLSHEHSQFLAYQILLGLLHMHSANIVHRDLKPANILVKADCTLKLCDFNLARQVECGMNGPIPSQSTNGTPNPTTNAAIMTDYVVTRWYRAPEAIIGLPYGLPLDMWSVGCIFAELHLREPLFPVETSCDATGQRPLNLRLQQLTPILSLIGSPSQADIDAIADEHLRARLSELPKYQPRLRERLQGLPEAVVELICSMLQFTPAKRPTVMEALQHPYFADLLTDAELHQATNQPLAYDPALSNRSMTAIEVHTRLLDEAKLWKDGAVVNCGDEGRSETDVEDDEDYGMDVDATEAEEGCDSDGDC